MTNPIPGADRAADDDSLNLCLSDLEHSSIYDNHLEMAACIKAVIARIRLLEAARAPAETQCKWPTCLPESEQQALAAQVHGELYSGAPAETPRPVAWEFEYNPSGNPLASWNREVFFHEPKPGPKVRNVRAMCYLAAQPAPSCTWPECVCTLEKMARGCKSPPNC